MCRKPEAAQENGLRWRMQFSGVLGQDTSPFLPQARSVNLPGPRDAQRLVHVLSGCVCEGVSEETSI